MPKRVDNQCGATTRAGKRCSRKATEGGYCKTHSKIADEDPGISLIWWKGYCERVLRDEIQETKVSPKGEILTIPIDQDTKLRYGRELAKINRWYEDQRVEVVSKVERYALPDNGKIKDGK